MAATRHPLINRLNKIEAQLMPEPLPEIIISFIEPPFTVTGVYRLVDGRLQEVTE